MLKFTQIYFFLVSFFRLIWLETKFYEKNNESDTFTIPTLIFSGSVTISRKNPAISASFSTLGQRVFANKLGTISDSIIRLFNTFKKQQPKCQTMFTTQTPISNCCFNTFKKKIMRKYMVRWNGTLKCAGMFQSVASQLSSLLISNINVGQRRLTATSEYIS